MKGKLSRKDEKRMEDMWRALNCLLDLIVALGINNASEDVMCNKWNTTYYAEGYIKRRLGRY
jgi:hypothetical protein